MENKVLELQNGFKWHFELKVLTKGGEKLKLTKKQEDLITLLANNDGIVTLEDIYTAVWGDSNIADINFRFALRNVVSNIRSFTYYGIIKNHSNIGYELVREVD